MVVTSEVERDELECELRKIDEDLMRDGITVLERSRALVRRKELYEALHPDTQIWVIANRVRKGRPPSASSFIRDMQARTGRGMTQIFEEVRIGKGITEAVEQLIKGTPIENRKVDLLGLSDLTDPQEQLAAAMALVERFAERIQRAISVSPISGRRLPAIVPKEVQGKFRVIDRNFARLEAVDPETAARYHPIGDRHRVARRMEQMVEWMNAFIAATRRKAE